jgi:hypothetical protein
MMSMLTKKLNSIIKLNNMLTQMELFMLTNMTKTSHKSVIDVIVR